MTSAEAGRLTGRPGASREPLGRAERLHLAVLAGVFALLAAMLGAGAIAFTSLSGQVALATVGPVEWFIPGTGLVSFCQAVVLPVFLELVAEAHCKVSRKEMEHVIEECFPA